MPGRTDNPEARLLTLLRMVGWGAAAVILLLPLISGAPWTLSDYVFMAVVLGGAGLLMEIVVRLSNSIFYWAGAGFALAAALGLVIVNGAVGFLGDEGNPANLIFFGVIAIAFIGSVFVGFKAAALARVMFATAAAQVLVGVVAVIAGLGAEGWHGLYEATLGTTLFGGLWLASSALFRHAALEGKSAAAAER